MPTISLHITEEELNQRIAEAATKASQQVAQALANDIMQVSLTRVPLEINPDELLLITIDFPDEAKKDQINIIATKIHDAFLERGITRVMVLPNTKQAKFNVSLIKQINVDAITGADVPVSSCEYDGTAYPK